MSGLEGTNVMRSTLTLNYQLEYQPFEFTLTGLVGPVKIPAVTMARYLLAFTDECTRFK